ncbi:hypothetical protein D3C86_1511210 [compost metagenome]
MESTSEPLTKEVVRIKPVERNNQLAPILFNFFERSGGERGSVTQQEILNNIRRLQP